jgi:putative polyketide hydroxylase
VPTSTDGRWIYARQVAPDEPEWDCTALLRTATGLPDLAPRVTSVLPFTMGGHLARAFRAGPVFVVGDAAHRTTPMGGIGMNTAIQSAHNLGWKLAWVLRGWAGDALLDSYEAERRPAGEEAVRRSLSPEIPVHGLTAELGTRYGAGTRFPHTWVGPGVSTIDLFDGRLTVLTGPHGDGWRRAAAEPIGPPVVALSPGHELDDVSGALTAQLGLSGAVLVRPDGYAGSPEVSTAAANSARPFATASSCAPASTITWAP